MKIIKYISILFTALLLSCAPEKENCATCDFEISDTTTQETTQALFNHDVDYESFIDKLSELNGTLIDVRTPEEFKNGGIDGAININFNADDFEDEINKLDKTIPVFVYCMGGGRSSKAMAKLNSLKFENVYNLIGGYSGFMHTENHSH